MSQNRFLKGSATLGIAGLLALGGWSAQLAMQASHAQQAVPLKTLDPAVKAHASALSKAFRNAVTGNSSKVHGSAVIASQWYVRESRLASAMNPPRERCKMIASP